MKTKKAWLAGILNFFFMGAGYLYNGRRMPIGAGLTLAAVGLTYVEFQIQPINMTLYGIMFAAVLVANTCLAIDGYQEARAINEGQPGYA